MATSSDKKKPAEAKAAKPPEFDVEPDDEEDLFREVWSEIREEDEPNNRRKRR